MLTNYVKIIFRNFLRHKNFAIINLSGLALGLSCCILILLWIQDELKFDAFHINKARLYRVLENQTYTDGVIQTVSATPGILADALKSEIPGITMSTQMTWEIPELLSAGGESHKAPGRYVQPDFLKMFTYPLVSGDPKTAFAKPNAIVISQKLANLYFGSQNPLGKTLLLNNRDEYEVTGVLRDVSFNSSIRFEFLAPFDQWLKHNSWALQYQNTGPRTLIMLQDGVTPEAVAAKIKNFIKQKVKNSNIELILQPYSEQYLYSEFKTGKQSGGRIEYIRSFGIVAMIVLIIACINFMNLATAQSIKRAKEIGIRKVSGAARRVLVMQFLGEAVLFSVIGLICSMLIVELLLPVFRQISGKEISINYTDPVFLLSLTGISVVTGIISGSYPALFLSSFNIVGVLKGRLKFNPGAVWMRKGLVVFQFCLTIVFIFCTIVIYRQIEFIKSKNLGFDRENLILINLEGDLGKKMGIAVDETSRLDGIKSATVSTTSPLEGGNSTTAVTWPGKVQDEEILFTQMGVGYDYVKTMGIAMKEGRDFSHEFTSDTAAYLINEETVRRMKLADPIGQMITFWERPGKIIGVMKDYHVNSLHGPIEPVILHLHPEWSNLMIARTTPGKTPEAIEGLRKLITQLNPTYPFEYHFVDDTFESQYKSETTVGTLAKYFSALAIFISCLGLLGLIMFTAEQRTKEIGVRKVLGASVTGILVLLSKDFIFLVMLAFVISTPVAWYLMDQWLHNFAYRIGIGWSIFAASGIVSVVIAILTLSLQGIKAASANPVDSLKNE